MEQITHTYRTSPPVLYYEVVYAGMSRFRDPCYAICNSYIFNNGLQGVRPKPVYA